MEHLVVGQGHLPPEVVASEGDQRISRGIFITDRCLLVLVLVFILVFIVLVLVFIKKSKKKKIILDLLYLHYEH